MPVPVNLTDLSVDPLVNSPPGTESAKGNIDNYLRQGFAFTRQAYNNLAGATQTIASATTTTIGGVPATWSSNMTITGTTTITAFDTVADGIIRNVTFAGALTLTHNATSLILPTGANITTVAGDCAVFKSLGGGNWRCLSYQGAGLPTTVDTGPMGGFRNRIINGDMRIDQRNSGAAVTPPFSAYLVDRFFAALPTGTTLTFQQVLDAPAGFKYSTKITVATQRTAAASDYLQFAQAIEGFNISDFNFGSANATQVTLSQYIKSSVPGTYSISLTNASNTRAYVGTINVTTSWALIVVTIPGDVTGTWLTDNNGGITVRLDLGSGSNYYGTGNAWQAGGYSRTAGSVGFANQVAGATLNITGVQLEAGSVATPFERRSYGLELALCQRYYWQREVITQSYPSSGLAGGSASLIPFPQPMRSVPSMATNIVDSNFVTSGSPVGAQWGLIVYGFGSAAKTGTTSISFIPTTLCASLATYGATYSIATNTLIVGPGITISASSEL